MTLTEAEYKRRVTDAERRVTEANRRVANCSAAERRAEEVADAERRAARFEQLAAEAERRATASGAIVTRPSQPKPITAPAPAARHVPKEIPVMSSRKKALLRDVESASARLATAKQSLDDAKHLYHAGMASDPVFAAHVVAGAESEWSRACAAYLSFKG